jgi:hypothetical protein
MVAPLSHARYLLVWGTLAAACIGLVAATNLLVDPYGIFGFINQDGFNRLKPHAGANGVMSKAYQIQRATPRTLLLGNSRVEVGFDPESPAWPQNARPVFNLGLPGTGPITSLRYLQHALASSQPGYVVLGVDFMDFLVQAEDRAPRVAAGPPAMERRLLVTPSGERNRTRYRQQIEDFASSALSLDAFFHSVSTVLAQHKPYAAHLTPLGFNPMHDYEGIARQEGYYVMFRQRDEENARAYLRRPSAIYQRGTLTSPQLDVVGRIIALCRERGIQLRLVIYPYHAHLLETFDAAGLWPQFEEWKRALARLAADAQAGGEGASIQLWDFSGYNAMTTEAVPVAGDRRSQTRWYWEAGHFKHELGDAMLRRMFGEGRADAVVAEGAPLTPANVEQTNVRLRREQAWYRQNFPDDARAMRELVRHIEARDAKR